MTNQPADPQKDARDVQRASLDKARAISRRWGDRLDTFNLPCPVCSGKLEFQGMLPNRLYEFAEGEPGVVEPEEIYALTFVCNRCGYAADFDAELFNPAYLATLAGAKREHIAELSVRDFCVLAPMRGDERSDTLLDLATAIVGDRAGDVIVVDLGRTDAQHAALQARVEQYRPARGDPRPVTILRRGPRALADIVRRQRADLVLMSVHSRTRSDESGLVDLLRQVLTDTTADIVLVYDRGLADVKRILFASAGGPSARAAAPFAISLTRAFEADLHVLYVAPPDDPNPHETAYQRIAETLEGIELEEDFLFQRRMLVDRNPTATIIAEAANYDLLVIGGSPEGWRTRLRLDSLSTKIARNAAATTLVTLSRSRRPRPWWSRLLG